MLKIAAIFLMLCLAGPLLAQVQHIVPQHSNALVNATIRFSYTLPRKEKAHALWFEKNGKLQGEENNNPLFFGTVERHHLEGTWKSWHSNGTLLDSGNLQKGIPHGTWQVWDEKGVLRAVRNYDAQLYQKVKNDIQLNHPRFSGFAITDRYKKEGATVINFLKAQASFPDAVRFTETFLEQAVLQNRKDMEQYHPVFLECLHHGLFLTYNEKGVLMDSGYYKNGLKEGVWVHRMKSGTLQKGMYKNGLHQMEWKEYDFNGSLLSILFYNEKGEMTRRKMIR